MTEKVFRVEEATVAQIHEAMKRGETSCKAVAAEYIRRIEA